MTTRHDPTRTATRQNKAAAECKRRLKICWAEIQAYLGRLFAHAVVVNKTYSFQVDEWTLQAITPDIERIIAAQFVEDGWLFGQYIGPTYTQGTMLAAQAIRQQAIHILPDIGQAAPAHMTAAFQARYNLIRSRIFEEMEGFSGATAHELGGIISRAILDGVNPLDISERIAERFGVALYRADRIARTEITTAMRRARLDEGEASARQIGLKVKFLHISAFSPTSRASHMARHGRTYSGEEVREWYSENANAINCRCSQTEILLDESGEPLAPGLIKRAEQIKEKHKHLLE